MVLPEQLAAARALKPIHERQVFGRSILLFDHADRQQLAALGEVRTPSIADLFVAVMGNQPVRHKERLNEYAIERHPGFALRFAGHRARGHVADPADVLVGAARIVGEPFHLYRAVDRRRGGAVRLPDQPAISADEDAGGDAVRPNAAARVHRRSRTTSPRF